MNEYLPIQKICLATMNADETISIKNAIDEYLSTRKSVRLRSLSQQVVFLSGYPSQIGNTAQFSYLAPHEEKPKISKILSTALTQLN